MLATIWTLLLNAMHSLATSPLTYCIAIPVVGAAVLVTLSHDGHFEPQRKQGEQK